MKKHTRTITTVTSLIISILFSFNGLSQELDASNYKMSFDLKTVKQADNSRLLELSFIGKNKKDRKDKVPVYDVDINFFNILDAEEVLLGKAKTSNEGIAQLTLSENQSYLSDEDGVITIAARFDGSEGLDSEEEEISFKNLFIKLNLAEIDSVKTVAVNAFTIDSLGNENPIDEAEIKFFVGGMLSKLKINEGEISHGEYEFKMPTDIPGDSEGNLTVYAMIDDNDDFGNLIQKQDIKWGVFDKQIQSEDNKLWSEAAPIWMYIVLTILLVGVWGNFAYTIMYLFKIKKDSKDVITS
jgi:hypothetical protein